MLDEIVVSRYGYEVGAAMFHVGGVFEAALFEQAEFGTAAAKYEFDDRAVA